MIIEGVLLSAIVRLAIAIFAAALGVFVLFRGRRMLWLFSGAAAFLLGVLLVRVLNLLMGNNPDSAEGVSWLDLIPVVAAVLGGLAGRYRQQVAYSLIGIAVGGALAIWLAQLVLPEGTGLDFWSAALVIILMYLGMLFVTNYQDVALIVLSAGVGASLITHALSLPADSLLVAALALALAIASLVIQYHDYLIELRTTHREETALLEPAEGTSDA